MNIAFVSNVVYPFTKGGAEKRIYEIGKRLSKNNKITVYGRHWWDGPKKIKNEGMILHGISPKRNLYYGDRRSITEALQFSKDLLSPLRKNMKNYDIVVTSVSEYFPVFSSKISTLFKRTPLVTTWHEVWGKYWKEYLGVLSPFGRTVEFLTANISQKPIAVSSKTADKLSNIGPRRSSIEIVPNGIDIKKIESITPAEKKFDILFVGRLIDDKNVDVLLNAFDKASKKYDIKMGIIGDGPEKSRLKNIMSSMEYSDRITFLGFLEDYEDVLAYMKSADIFVLPSTREGFGITFLEAMASGCKVITVDHPNSTAREVVGSAGFITDLSVSSIHSEIENALNGKKPKEDPVKRAKKYDWDKITNQAEKVYKKALEK